MALNVRQFVVVTLATRIASAFVTLSLAGLLSVTAYSEFSFLQITAGISTQIAFGIFSNVVTARMAGIQDKDDVDALMRYGLLYGGVICIASFSVLLLVGWTNVAYITSANAAVIVIWMWANYCSAIANGLYAARSRYGTAALMATQQIITYISFLVLFGTRSGTLAIISASASLLIPPLIILCFDGTLRPTWKFVHRRYLRDLFKEHLYSAYVNASYIPSLLLLWVLTATVASHVSAEQFARLGVANQFANLFLFIPTSLASVAIPLFARETSLSVQRRLVTYMMLGLGSAGLLAAIALPFLISLASGLLPPLVGSSAFETMLALSMAALVAARAPFAWINQVSNKPHLESSAAILGAIILGVCILFGVNGTIDMLIGRIALSLALLILSAILYSRFGKTG